MAKNRKTGVDTMGSDSSTNGEGEAVHEESETPARPEKKPAETSIRKAGDTFAVGGEEVTFEAERHFAASSSSGVSPGVYPVVSIILKPGNRKVYRAVVGDVLYPIREHGTPDEIISKIRGESKEPRKPRKAPAAKTIAHATDEGPPISLSDSAAEVLRDYLSLRQEYDQDEVLSDLVEAHLGPEVKKLKAAQQAISKLPLDLLTALGSASEEQRKKILEALKQ